MIRIGTACVLVLLLGCPSQEDSVALADQDKGVQAAAPDLDAFAAMRARSEGGALTDELQEAQSLNAQKAYASKEGEPSQAELAAAGAAPVMGGAGAKVIDLGGGGNAGRAAPSDLDTLEDTPDAPWINMKLVEEKIRSRDRAMKTCWDTHGPAGPGRVELRMTIGAGGRASTIALAPSSPVQDGAVADCLARTLRNVKYPEPRNGAVTFLYPVKF